METTPSTVDRSDIVIIGGGPTGLFGAFYAGQRRMSVKIIDSLPELGGQLTALYPDKLIYDVAGFPEILARDLVNRLVEQAMKAAPEICLEEQLLAMDRLNEDWIAVTSNKDTHITRSVLIAGGIGSFAPRTMRTPGVETLTDRGVSHFVRHKESMRGKRVLIVGGGDSACDWALTLIDVAAHITLIHQRDVFQAHEESVERLLASSVDVRVSHELARVHGEKAVEGVTISDKRTGEEDYLQVDAVVLAIGFQAALGPIKEWSLNLDKNRIVVDSTMATNLPGIYAGGDIATYPGKLNLIATGVAEAAVAVNHAKAYIDPTAKVSPGHSSEKKESTGGADA